MNFQKKKNQNQTGILSNTWHLMWILKDVLQSSFRHACLLYKQQVQMILNLKRMFWPKKTLVLEFPNHIFLDAKIFFPHCAEENTPVQLELTIFFCKRSCCCIYILFTDWDFFLCSIDQDVESRVVNYTWKVNCCKKYNYKENVLWNYCWSSNRFIINPSKKTISPCSN